MRRSGVGNLGSDFGFFHVGVPKVITNTPKIVPFLFT